tara:strand:+ start:265 stop:1071 length:807 start_codon:yes stop_codon:yes gene_type:complete
MEYKIHETIINKLNCFLKDGKIPNLILHGPSGGGKKTILENFIKQIYNNDKTCIKENVMIVNCAHGKGIKFVRDTLKLFAKTHVNFKKNINFKSVILINADKLTMDAQSALRRCIELFSYSTRFFIVVEDKYKVLKPILSRFCEIYIPYPIINNKKVNLHILCKQNSSKYEITREKWLTKYLKNITVNNYTDIINISEILYEKAYSGIDIINYFDKYHYIEDNIKKYQYLLTFNRIKLEINNEKLLIMFLLNFIFLRSDINLENISFM